MSLCFRWSSVKTLGKYFFISLVNTLHGYFVRCKMLTSRILQKFHAKCGPILRKKNFSKVFTLFNLNKVAYVWICEVFFLNLHARSTKLSTKSAIKLNGFSKLIHRITETWLRWPFFFFMQSKLITFVYRALTASRSFITIFLVTALTGTNSQ